MPKETEFLLVVVDPKDMETYKKIQEIQETIPMMNKKRKPIFICLIEEDITVYGTFTNALRVLRKEYCRVFDTNRISLIAI